MAWLPDTAILAAVLTAAVGLYWNFHNAKAARMLPFLNRQLELCFEATDVVAILATTSDPKIWGENRDRFWQLFYGVLAVVEGREVEGCMVACSEFIPPTGAAPQLPNSTLCDSSLALSQSVRRLLIEAWKIKDLESTLAGKKGVFEEVRQTYNDEFDRQMAKSRPVAENLTTKLK